MAETVRLSARLRQIFADPQMRMENCAESSSWTIDLLFGLGSIHSRRASIHTSRRIATSNVNVFVSGQRHQFIS